MTRAHIMLNLTVLAIYSILYRHGLHTSGEEPKLMVLRSTLPKSGLNFGSVAVDTHLVRMMLLMVILPLFMDLFICISILPQFYEERERSDILCHLTFFY